MSFSRLSFLWHIVGLLAKNSFSVLLMPFLCQALTDRETPNFLSHCRSSCAFARALHLRGHTPFVRLSFFLFLSVTHGKNVHDEASQVSTVQKK